MAFQLTDSEMSFKRGYRSSISVMDGCLLLIQDRRSARVFPMSSSSSILFAGVGLRSRSIRSSVAESLGKSKSLKKHNGLVRNVRNVYRN